MEKKLKIEFYVLIDKQKKSVASQFTLNPTQAFILYGILYGFENLPKGKWTGIKKLSIALSNYLTCHDHKTCKEIFEFQKGILEGQRYFPFSETKSAIKNDIKQIKKNRKLRYTGDGQL